MLDIKLTNGQRISKIAIVSEAYVLEFFKQFGEYETTVFAEFVDEFEENFVYFGETAILPHTTEASIKVLKRNVEEIPLHNLQQTYLYKFCHSSLQEQKVEIQQCGYTA